MPSDQTVELGIQGFVESGALQSWRGNFSFVDAFGTMAGISSSVVLQQRELVIEEGSISAGVAWAWSDHSRCSVLAAALDYPIDIHLEGGRSTRWYVDFILCTNKDWDKLQCIHDGLSNFLSSSFHATKPDDLCLISLPTTAVLLVVIVLTTHGRPVSSHTVLGVVNGLAPELPQSLPVAPCIAHVLDLHTEML